MRKSMDDDVLRVSFQEEWLSEASQESDKTFICTSLHEIATETLRVLSVFQFFALLLSNSDLSVAPTRVYVCMCVHSSSHNKLAFKTFPPNAILIKPLKTTEVGELQADCVPRKKLCLVRVFTPVSCFMSFLCQDLKLRLCNSSFKLHSIKSKVITYNFKVINSKIIA